MQYNSLLSNMRNQVMDNLMTDIHDHMYSLQAAIMNIPKCKLFDVVKTNMPL